MATIKELITQFYTWERRGRGWDIAAHPVDLEPPFHPFFGHYIPSPPIDDGRRPTFLSSIADLFRKQEPSLVEDESVLEPAYIPFLFSCDENLERLSILLSSQHKFEQGTIEELLSVLSYCQYPVSFEIIADAETIQLQLVCRESETEFIQQQLRTYVRDCIIVNTTNKGENIFSVDERPSLLIDFGLEEEFMRPLLTEQRNSEPFSNFLTLCNHIDQNERLALQVLFCGVVNSWAESILSSVTDRTGKSFFIDAPEMPRLAELKNSSTLFAVTIRILSQSDTEDRSRRLAKQAAVALKVGTHSTYNSLLLLHDDTYTFETRASDMLNRQSHRTGMLLNAKELAQFVHIPSPTWSKKFEYTEGKTKLLPKQAIGHQYTLGMNEHFGTVQEASLSIDQRLKHLHVVGATGTGKSTLLLNLIHQDMQNGNGIAVLDAHGDLIESVLSFVPKHRIRDVIVIDPSDIEHPIPFNLLKAHTAIEKEILSSDLVASFKRLSSSWGDQMNSVFANAILAFLNSTKGGTLIELRRFLIEKSFRESFLKTVQDEHVLYYWQHEYPLLKSSSIGSILTRLDIFLRPTLIRAMVGQKDCIDMAQLMDTKKIVLVKLSHGIIGVENSYLLGTAIVSKMQQIAMSRQILAKDNRNDFFIYIDEFQHFITPSMNTILSGARKYHVGLILAHQSMQQLQKQDSELAGEVIANAGTRICFRLGEYDARLFNSSFSSFTSDDLQRLDTGHAIARIERADADFTLITPVLGKPEQNEAGVAAIIDHSQRTYTKKQEPKNNVATDVETTEQSELLTKQTHDVTQSSENKQAPSSKEDVDQTLQQFAKRKEMQQHRSLQHVVKDLAEASGYVSTLEAPLVQGTGKVDVALSKGDRRIACEVSISTDVEWESHNIEKCLLDGFDAVWCIVSCKATKTKLEAFVSTLNPKDATRITIVDVHHMQSLFEQLPVEQSAPTEQIIKGYRVKVEYGNPNTEDLKQKQDSLKNILRSTKRK